MTDTKKMNAIWDAISARMSPSEMEAEFLKKAIAAGIDEETAEGFLMGGDI